VSSSGPRPDRPPPAAPDLTGLLARCTFPPSGTELTCAVSGGADSLALLVLAVEAGCRVTAVHVDHGLRPDSSGEAAIVRTVASRLGAGFRAERVAVEPGGNLEARAREARRAVLPPGTATGHTADDQAETVVLNLLRGAGLDGLAGMRAGPEHPILALRRAETRALGAALGLTPVQDPTNDCLDLRRNRVRHQVLPLLDEVAERDVAAVVARQASLLAEDAALLESLAAGLDPTSVADLRAAPPPLARRAVRTWLRAELAGYPPPAAAVERVLAVVAGETRAAEVGAGVTVRRHAGRLHLSRYLHAP
jgi:tRNA(Ile)-lysidine synthase